MISKSTWGLDPKLIASQKGPVYQGLNDMSVDADTDGPYSFPHRIDPDFRPGVWIDGEMVIEGREYSVLATGYIYFKYLKAGSRIHIRAYLNSDISAEEFPEIRIVDDSLGDTKSNAPEQARPKKKVKYNSPTHKNYVAQLSFKRATWQTGNDLIDITREELEYLVTAGKAILKHLKEEEDNVNQV